MEQVPNEQYENTATTQPVEPSLNFIAALPQSGQEEESANFFCQKCKKMFYNLNALQNHNNMTHNMYYSRSDGEINRSSMKLEQNVHGLYGFEFIPLSNSEGNEEYTTGNGLTTRVFAEDMSYLIVKVKSDDDNMENAKKSRIDGFLRKNPQKPAIRAVDLRGPFTCTFPSSLRPDLQCRQIFFSCCEYSIHYREEHTKRRKAALRCQVCEQRLDRDIYLRDLLAGQYHATNGFTFSCQMCGLKFLDSFKYDEHNRTMHAKTKPHQCTVCSKRFTQQGGLQQHMRMHTGVRPFVCTFCPKAFTQKAGLDQHIRTHTKVKPFKCVICSKCFSQSVHLRQHMRTHTNIQPFECSVCGRRFKQRSHLNFHLRSHMSRAGVLRLDNCPQPDDKMDHDKIDFLNMSNLQPVQDGETLYYAANLTSALPYHPNPFGYQNQPIMYT